MAKTNKLPIVNESMEHEVLRRMYQGEGMHKIALSLGVDPVTMLQHFARSDELTNGTAHARTMYLIDTLHTLDQVIYDMDICPQRAKLKVDLVKWELSKMMPKVYGDKIINDINVNIDISGAIEQAQRRIESRFAADDIEDAEIVESPSFLA